MLLDFGKVDRGLDEQMVESVASSTIMCQCLCMLSVLMHMDLSMLKKEVMMAKIFVSVCIVRRDEKRLRVCVRAFFMFHVSQDEIFLI